MPIREIQLLGNPILRAKCSPVKDVKGEEIQALISDLRDTLADFRSRRGFGRGIAAPQIGSANQIIYINFEMQGPLINPKIVKRSRKKFMLWDDCFSFPDLLVKVERNFGIVVSYLDSSGQRRTLTAEDGLSELLQHEIDHINGILAIDRAIDSRHIIFRTEHEKLSSKAPVML